jgi:hypothetical protein
MTAAGEHEATEKTGTLGNLLLASTVDYNVLF